MLTEGDGEVEVVGVYQTIERPRSITFIWRWQGNPTFQAADSTVDLTFESLDGGTMLRLVQVGIQEDEARANHGHGWNGAFDKLETLFPQKLTHHTTPEITIMSDDCATDEDKTPGIFSWRELVTQDPEGSRKFYTELFGWTEETMPMPGGMDCTIFKNGDTPVAVVMKPPGEKADIPTTWINYVTVEDLEATVAKAQDLGDGHLCMPITEIPDKGRFAGVADPQGALSPSGSSYSRTRITTKGLLA